MSACNCPSCYKRRGWESEAHGAAAAGTIPDEAEPTDPCAGEVVDFVLPPPTVVARPSLYDELVADVIAGLVPLRTIYGLDISDEAMRDRAANIVQGLVVNYHFEPAPEGRS